ncbi:hypothetical protein DB35_03655 [Streptomyces abyssalis]|uniref:Uncharacterized protein n=1 Tax=Streptomyces abyssalis TaxID=933944 RepID=A0A1E7JR99_9ACTN|nr:hypothetical protein [Streptomyces abyssalis]OEU90785.1 hypothetical protein AN215_12770 [Streptomyces abyssalis]OEU95403.1 hypothetical protein DB35_03655 [Streptomyces abyssalis]
MTHVTNYMLERSRNRHELLTRWDDKKLDAYEGYVDRIRAMIFLAVQLYEHREGIREGQKSEPEMLAELADASRLRGRAFERVMLLGGDEVVEAGHRLNAAVAEVDWQATGRTSGTLDEWRARNRAAFQAINNFHDAARVDLGVKGNVSGESHPERDLLLPPAQRSNEKSPQDARESES